MCDNKRIKEIACELGFISVKLIHEWGNKKSYIPPGIDRILDLINELQDIEKEENCITAPYKTDTVSNNTFTSIKDKEKDLIVKALEQCLWIQKDAAALLGISPRVLSYKIKNFNIRHQRWRKFK